MRYRAYGPVERRLLDTPGSTGTIQDKFIRKSCIVDDSLWMEALS